MKKVVIVVILIFGLKSSWSQILLDSTLVDTVTVARNLHIPWEILWGPDDKIWFTERQGRIKTLNPETGQLNHLLTLTDVHQSSESGLLGMALHPNMNDTPHVYIVYTYLKNGTAFTEKLVRYTFTGDTLIDPVIILDNIQGATNHDGSRLLITPDRKIIMTTGDAANINYPQQWNRIEGKILRMNLDGSVPDDNPVPGSLIWSKGHRNPQGLVLGTNGILYSSEHGPNDNDELNIIKKKGNYGWPNVRGFCNDVSEQQFCNDSAVVEPLVAWTPTLAVCGTDFYHSAAIPEFNNGVLIVTLKEQDIRLARLNAEGDSVILNKIYFNNYWGRLRDICISPSGDIYLSTSNRDNRAVSPFPKTDDDRIVRIRKHDVNNTVNTNNTVRHLQLFPNPAGNNVTVAGFTAASGGMIHIEDILGQQMITQSMTINGGAFNESVSLSGLTPGVYLVKIEIAGSITSKKLIIQ